MSETCTRVTINGHDYVREDVAPQDPDVALPWKVGAAYLIRTVTMAWTGRVVAVYEHEIVLDEAAWIPDTGRYHRATIAAALLEVEPAGDGIVIGRGSVVDARPWTSALPSKAK